MAQWQGKSRGTVLGYKIFVFFIKKVGINAAYLLLLFVAFYFFLFTPNNTRALYYYYRKRKKNSFLKSTFCIYKTYFVFGQTIIDKIAIASGLRDSYTYNFDGIEHLQQLIKEKQGGILISAHVGNFEIAERFFGELGTSTINLVTVDAEHGPIKEYLDTVTEKPNVQQIYLKEDLSHIFEIHNALDRNELICFTGDRFVEGTKFLEEEFLGEKAKFPAGPFTLASRLKVPVMFVYVMKEGNKHYHLFTIKAKVKTRDAQALLKQYTENVESILEKYPLQWFNFYDFWGKDKRD